MFYTDNNGWLEQRRQFSARRSFPDGTSTLVAPDATRAQLPLVLSLSVLATGAVRLLIDEDSSISPSELHRADPSVTKPAERDEDMDGPWQMGLNKERPPTPPRGRGDGRGRPTGAVA